MQSEDVSTVILINRISSNWADIYLTGFPYQFIVIDGIQDSIYIRSHYK
jgi:hypothetical protein